MLKRKHFVQTYLSNNGNNTPPSGIFVDSSGICLTILQQQGDMQKMNRDRSLVRQFPTVPNLIGVDVDYVNKTVYTLSATHEVVDKKSAKDVQYLLKVRDTSKSKQKLVSCLQSFSYDQARFIKLIANFYKQRHTHFALDKRNSSQVRVADDNRRAFYSPKH
jgi:hypothetical protein